MLPSYDNILGMKIMAYHCISYLSKSSLAQYSVLSECVFSDGLPDGTQTQQNPLIDAYMVLIKTEILSVELNTLLSLFPVQRVGSLVCNFTFQTQIQSRQPWTPAACF